MFTCDHTQYHSPNRHSHPPKQSWCANFTKTLYNLPPDNVLLFVWLNTFLNDLLRKHNAVKVLAQVLADCDCPDSLNHCSFEGVVMFCCRRLWRVCFLAACPQHLVNSA